MYIDNRGCYLSDTDKARGHVFIYVNNIAVTRKTYNSAGALMNIIYIILPRGVRLTLLKGHLRSTEGHTGQKASPRSQEVPQSGVALVGSSKVRQCS